MSTSPLAAGLRLDDPLLGLSARTLNSLLRAGYTTIADIESATDEALLDIRQFGVAQLREARAKVAQYRTIVGVTACPLRLPEPTRIRVADLEITARTRDRLLAAGLTTAADVEALTEDALLALTGFGATCLADYKHGRFLHAAQHGILLDISTLIRRDTGGARDRRWMRHRDLLATHVAAYGSLPSSRLVTLAPGGERVRLGSWLAKQRDLYRRGALAQDRVEALEAIDGWTWEVPVGRPRTARAA